jgi:curved DNA-binding protein CbpA
MVVVDFEKDYYAILGLENTATLDEIKKTYRVLAKQYHPDVNKAPNATEIFNAISESYEILSDERQRAEYDEHSVHGAPKHNLGSTRAKAGGGVSTGQRKRARQASPADVRLERTLLLSLIVPGVFQIASGDRKTGGLLLAGYVVFWALAIIYSVEIGVLAVMVWAIAILDSYNSFRKRTWESAEQGN